MFLSISRLYRKAKPKDWIQTWKIRQGDQVHVCEGKSKGQRGEVLYCDFKRNTVFVKGVNLRKTLDDQGKPLMVERAMHVSNVALIDQLKDEPTRVRLRRLGGEENDLVRISVKSGMPIAFPEREVKRFDTSKAREGPKDTPPEVALKKTYDYQKEVETMKIIRETLSKYNTS